MLTGSIGRENETAAEANRGRAVTGGASQRLERGPLLPLAVLVAAGLIYACVFCRAESIPTAVGANLVPAERMLKGEVPYRDFYKIQTPGILLINAALFMMFGTSLLTAVTAVFVFKVLTIAIMFICTRSVSDWKLALVASLLSLVWVAPGGPFRSAPVQFEMLFVVLAIWFSLRWMSDGRARDVFLAGLAVGMVAVFKQNVGVYSAVALAVSVILNRRRLRRLSSDAAFTYEESSRGGLPALGVAALGVAAPLGSMAIYLAIQGALGPAIKVFLKGPGEHLGARFTGYPVPKAAALIIAAALLAFLVTRWLLERCPRWHRPIITLLLLGATTSAFLVSQAVINNWIYWFAPSVFVCAIWEYYRGRRKGSGDDARVDVDRTILLTLLLFSMAAYGEVFPRSVRGLVIDTMPPAFILLVFLCRGRHLRGAEERVGNSGSREWGFTGVILATVCVVLLVFAARTVGPGYFEIGHGGIPRLKADTELNFDRGRGVYLPAKHAGDVNALVEVIRSKVEPGGYMFAHSLDTTSYYFLADRNSPTAATLWNDAGTNDAERARIVGALREKQVRLVLTSEQATARERYDPLIDMLTADFHEAIRIGQIIVLERNF